MLSVGTRLGVYEVTAQIGAGGMGEVYRATDTKLKRQVAIKILPPSLAADHDRLARFQREAEVLASLNHPNIAAIYGLEEGPAALDGAQGREAGHHVRALVMELVEGEDLSQRMARGAIPLDEALPIAKQIAEALEYAHEHGVVHRDLKPANIKLTSDGAVKVLDFGLAKAMGPAEAGHHVSTGEDVRGVRLQADLTHSPTITTPAMTQAGMILGTAAYMSPEQAKGKAVDKRTDIWSFGVVLFEMLTGRRAFDGEDMTEVLGAVVRLEPLWDALPPDVPPPVRTLLQSCLVKDPRRRVADISTALFVLDKVASLTAPAVTPSVGPATSSASRGRLMWMAALAVAAAVIVALAIPAVRHLREKPSSAMRVVSFTMDLAPADRLGPTSFYGRPVVTAFAISPDGATIVFGGEVTAPSPTTMLYRRPLAEAQAVRIPGTEGAEYPFFSPDGQWVGFAAGNKLKKVALSGGPPIDLCDFTFAGRIDGASWGPSGVIAFARQGLWTVSDSGGKPGAVFLTPSPQAFSMGSMHWASVDAPHMLPDGQTALFTEAPSLKWEEAHVDAIDLTTKQRKTLLTNAADARYSPTGHLVFVRNAALLAVPFDTTRVEVTGAPVPLLAGVMQSTNAVGPQYETGMGQFALSASGVLVYASGDRYPTPTSILLRVDRKGVDTRLAEVKGYLAGLRLSSSGSRVVAFKGGDGSLASDIWMYDLPSGTPTRLTSTGEETWPLFSLDSKSVAFLKDGRNGGIYSLPLNGSATPQRIIEPTPGVVAASWSPDGKWLAYLQTVGNVPQIFVRPIRDGKPDAGEPRQFSPSTFTQRDAEFSPNSRWIAYTSNESGASEVYVQAFPGPGERHRISSDGGTNPAWSRNGGELFYLSRPKPGAPTRSMMAVDFSTTGDFKASVPHLLFEGLYDSTTPLRSHDVTPDGQFIMSRPQRPPDQPVTKLNVVLGWAESLKARVPSGK